MVPFTSFFALLSPWWLITAAVKRKFSGLGLLTGFRLWPPFPWLSSCLDFWSAQWRLMCVVYGDLRHGAAVTIKESSAERVLVLCRLHSKSSAFSASLCSLRHPSPRTGRRWPLLVLGEPLLEVPLGLIPSPLGLLQPDTEF